VNISTAACSRTAVTIRDDGLPQISPECELAVFVVFTSVSWTLKALEKAREIARPVGAKIVVVAVHVVPYPLALHEPPVPMEFVIRRFEEKVREFPERTYVSAYLCRDLKEAFKRILSRNSPVIIGVKKRWFPGRDERLARKLRRSGHDVILVKTE
jgi:hypothetical protein